MAKRVVILSLQMKFKWWWWLVNGDDDDFDGDTYTWWKGGPPLSTLKWFHSSDFLIWIFNYNLGNIFRRNFKRVPIRNDVNQCHRMHVPIVSIFWQKNEFSAEIVHRTKQLVWLYSLFKSIGNWNINFHPLTKDETWNSWCASNVISLES